VGVVFPSIHLVMGRIAQARNVPQFGAAPVVGFFNPLDHLHQPCNLVNHWIDEGSAQFVSTPWPG